MSSMLFVVSVLGMIAAVPIHFLSVEHRKLERKYGYERGKRVGGFLGMISGWGFFGFWIGIWISSQPRFSLPAIQNLLLVIPVFNAPIYLVQLLIASPFMIAGAWLGIAGVRATSLKAAETHRSETIVRTGVYSHVRHPQYLGGLLSHLGMSVLLSGLYSLLVSPLVILLNYLISWKEEKELMREFGGEYGEYQKNTPMFLPRLRLRKAEGC